MKIADPAFNYDKFGHTYSGHRQTDPRIAAYVNTALEHAKTILNVGAGGGSYEPDDHYVVAVEPSFVMREQRKANNKVPGINAKADHLPFDDNAFDASMAMVTVHHWPDIAKGLQELRRVTKEQVIIMTFDPDALDEFWNAQYFPELIAVEKARYPTVDFISNALGGNIEVIPVPIPLDCTDGFQEAFYGRPEAFLQKEVRQSQSAWGFLPEATASELVKRLEDDLLSGEWNRKYGHFRTQAFFTGALRLIISRP
ncbi:class I SAM-dependent methyltransferase [Taibaiella lutea]|uniref:Class I SAM-dependent methyltransferase n=1 Tax=Taibaiella lutea TaxID=2608001 RepID=A0A5M6CBJ9_9BACT|nr:class I SAM-dependent methyltransferase [Taibaiella lutea]KAA5532524.1 class I SAM-dependent methyltransferase [Taibaiella lutea]